ncbi:helix-turn-helix domain-containing protein [Rhizobium lentis]|uniref:helix-turn-helix domain-containing protein n=1 Tax=Rhizobium TaxID=379 RepID=UPI00160EFA24|nr:MULTISPECIES: helix-turn-helix domain-containing protein [Rhizobium]MBB3350790.1 AraC family transcriptional activator of pobA [Rhizobium sp. BK049]MBX5131580.1 helix-turn-helix domain-containing protein [Rhizobium lentis]MBX5150603.1 helix-turn-helix domain-containing protein [Rhizobium lentis]MBX5175431.1 helix-turn-helix domain-containing protein [Rhizobium lentis]
MSRHIPTYELYGENTGRSPEFWLHCETIRSRSSLHQWEIRLHRHESFFQILYIEAGSGDAIFGNRNHAICPPAIITVPPGLNHGFRFSRDIDGLVITILKSHLSHPPGERSQLGEWLAMPLLTPLAPDNAEAAYVMQTLRRLGDEFENRRGGRNEVLAAYVGLALRLTARISHEGHAQELPSNENERRMEMLDELIQQHFRSHRPASFYAKELGISSTHLSRIVRSMTGNTPHELIAGKLIEEAKRQLVFTIGSVQEIGFRLGFADPAYFSRFFLKYTGETPRVWRMNEKARLERA